jgi:hypothetical protein
MTEQTNVVSLADRRKAQVLVQSEPPIAALTIELTEAEARSKYVEDRKNILDFLTNTLVVCNQSPELTEAVIFLRTPDGGFMPGATSQATMDELLAAMGSQVEIQAMPDGDDDETT